MKSLKEKACETLETLASDLISTAGSVFVWGEEEVPECLRRELEAIQEQE